jgi:nitrogen fixation protein NifQ
MDPQETYAWLVGRPRRKPTDRFDLHVLASVFTLALVETDWGCEAPLSEALGLSFDDAVAAVVSHFPHAVVEIGAALSDGPVERSDDEACLLDLLWRSAADHGEFGGRLAKLVARRAQRPNHLWQDLGLRNRGELSTLMSRHFPRLARRNDQDMKWKKFLYRIICRDASYALCTAPSCLECDDFQVCFGDESGESLLAQMRRAGDAAAAVA